MPLVSILSTDNNISTYLEFPPKTRYVEHAPFSEAVFTGIGLFILLVIFPFIWRVCTYHSIETLTDQAPPRKPQAPCSGEQDDFIGRGEELQKKRLPFPWWGYIGLMLGMASWILAWTRFEWFGLFQLHTFTPLWLAYILVINAWTHKRSRHCMMMDRPGFFLLLFPISIGFWWFFEYLNRFVQNWYYVEIARFSPVEYFVLASVSFSTVLPAVLGTRDFLLTFNFFDKAFGSFVKLNPSKPKLLGAVFLLLSSMSLVGIGAFPSCLYPLLWVSPLAVIVSLQVLASEKHIFSALTTGDWRLLVTSALAALVCGFFWEMWNFYSLAKWIYSIPYVQRFPVFEMPLLGYAGYLPFGFECAVIADLIEKLNTTRTNISQKTSIH